MRFSTLALALCVIATPTRALPEGVLEVGAGGAVGAIVGGVVAGGVVLVLADQGESLSRSVGITDDSFQQLLVDFYALPAAGAVVGAGVGAFAMSAWQGRPCAPAVALAPLGAGVVGGVCSLPGMLAAGVAFDEADQADNCGEACGAAIAGVLYGAIGIASFCVGAPIGAGLAGAGGAALVAPDGPAEVPPPPPSPPPTPPPPIPTDEAPVEAPDAAPEAPPPAGDPPPVLDPATETTTPTEEPPASLQP
jgi:hypothetical protein